MKGVTLLKKTKKGFLLKVLKKFKKKQRLFGYIQCQLKTGSIFLSNMLPIFMKIHPT